jgi:hypothetical protein
MERRSRRRGRIRSRKRIRRRSKSKSKKGGTWVGLWQILRVNLLEGRDRVVNIVETCASLIGQGLIREAASGGNREG